MKFLTPISLWEPSGHKLSLHCSEKHVHVKLSTWQVAHAQIPHPGLISRETQGQNGKKGDHRPGTTSVNFEDGWELAHFFIWKRFAKVQIFTAVSPVSLWPRASMSIGVEHGGASLHLHSAPPGCSQLNWAVGEPSLRKKTESVPSCFEEKNLKRGSDSTLLREDTKIQV